MCRILVVDDDPHILDILTFSLQQAGMEVLIATDGQKALELFQREDLDLLILDVLMPELDGLTLCRHIRRTSDIPILFLSSRDAELDRVLGLDLGGDDYVTKPFSPREVVARVHSILRRTRAQSTLQETAVHAGALRLCPEKHQVSWKEIPVRLTAAEFALLLTLVKRPGRVAKREELLLAYAPESVVSDRTIDSHIRHIRAKFAQAGCLEIIETVHGLGYRLGNSL